MDYIGIEFAQPKPIPGASKQQLRHGNILLATRWLTMTKVLVYGAYVPLAPEKL